MAEYLVEINPKDAAHFAAALNDEEAGGAAFVKSSVTFFDSRFTNLALFRELPPGQLPGAEVEALAHSAPPPTGKVLLWSGAVLVAGSNAALSVYR